jgi:3-dehydroquinate synthase/shikimate kinase/3-dehydroquinate synthase
MKMIKVIVKTNNHKYPLIIGPGLINKLSLLFKSNSINFSKCLLVIDKKIPRTFIKIILKSLNQKSKFIHFIHASELNKNQKNVNKILEKLLKNNFHRDDCLISIGGGITGDVSGFAASIFKRGISFVNIPTTLLAQVDSSIGGKTGINSNHGKNLIGSFYQPSLVISDTNFLKTLPKRELICGYGEILKHALISGKKFFSFLETNGSKILDLKTPFIERAIFKSCVIKKKIIELDEKENNFRKILNFGHTFAHAYEATLGYSKKLNHGEAVILGIISASKFSLQNSLLSNNEFKLIINHINKLHLPKRIGHFLSIKKLNKIIYFMLKDKKNNNSKINLVLLNKIGKPSFNLYFKNEKLRSFVKKELINKNLY